MLFRATLAAAAAALGSSSSSGAAGSTAPSSPYNKQLAVGDSKGSLHIIEIPPGLRVPGAGEGQGCAVTDWLALPEPVPVPRSAHDGLRAGVGVGLPPSPPVPVGLALVVARMLLLAEGLALRVAPAESLAAALLLA
jgi:hypothetical protein